MYYTNKYVLYWHHNYPLLDPQKINYIYNLFEKNNCLSHAQKEKQQNWMVVSTHFKNMSVKMGSSSPNSCEHKQIFETTT